MRVRRIEVLLFALAWLSYASFHQGGGWNQNGRFALTRALVESRRPWIDDYLVYAPRGGAGSEALRRVPVKDGVFTEGGHTYVLAWYAGPGPLIPLSPDHPPDARPIVIDTAAVTGDLAFARGHAHPNKAPGASFAAAPAYAAIWGIERAAGLDPDDAWVMTANAWLAGAAGIGLLAAVGVVAFWRLALRLSQGDARASLYATVALAFGTLYFPYATMLYDHDLVAVALTASFLLASGEPTGRRLFGAGLCAGAAVVASYLSVIGLAILGAYVWHRARPRSRVAVFLAGTIPPLAILGLYNIACFGRLVTTNYAWQNPYFRDAQGGFLEIFGGPDLGVLAALLVSPARGLFPISPVLLIGGVGLVRMIRSRSLRAEGWVCAAMIAHLLAFNITFKAWHGGWACGPRYLIPALPFLALPMISVAAGRGRWIRRLLLAVSVLGMAIVTVVDPQPPFGYRVDPPIMWSPIWNIDLPQFAHGRPGRYGTQEWPKDIVARYREPVSVNPGGIYEGMPGRFFGLGSASARWSSFNVGEFALPGSRLSVLSLALAAAALALLVRREAQRGAA
ncbi:MAG TPA: hypothetical protein VFB67_13465 [Candidatus Polarisedimenticolaceae bacterium]|nr:hypothetical protein [Candidatus Polarisedimenticolaceae bacterium]